jgi:hypothetical protein
MKAARSSSRGDRGWRRGIPAGATELLNRHWHSLRGGPNPRSCPVCAANLAAGDDAVHYGGEIYHLDCAPQRRPSKDAAGR